MSLPTYQAGSTIALAAPVTWPEDGLPGAGQPVDLTGAELIEFEVLPPGGALLHWPAAAVGLPTAGVVGYTTSTTDCLLAGIWRAQIHVVWPNGNEYRSDPDLYQWRVKANLPGA
jgi:hypothetical protein